MNFAVNVNGRWLDFIHSPTVKVWPGLHLPYTLFFFQLDKKNRFVYTNRLYFDTAEELYNFLLDYLKVK